jgi:hypothetical protein
MMPRSTSLPTSLSPPLNLQEPLTVPSQEVSQMDLTASIAAIVAVAFLVFGIIFNNHTYIRYFVVIGTVLLALAITQRKSASLWHFIPLRQKPTHQPAN